MADDAPGPRASADGPPAGPARVDAEAAKATCRHFASRGACLFGDACAFSHDVEPGTSRRPAGADARVPPGAAFPTSPRVRTLGKGRRNVENKSKCSVFRRWALETFGHALLCSGAGVLDVAGGKGELAFELLNVSGVPVTVVDPRPMRLDTYVRKFRAGFYHRNRAPAVVASVRRPADAPLAAPEHCRVFFFPDAWRERDADKRAAAARASWHVARETRWSRRGLVVASANECATGPSDGPRAPEPRAERSDRRARYLERGEPARQRALFESRRSELAAAPRPEAPDDPVAIEPFGTDPRPDPETEETAPPATPTGADARASVPEAMDAEATFACLERAMAECSVVLGMHPDQATECVVDFALERGKPFAVVPCCVYSREFPARRRPATPERPRGGGAVTTHAHLVEYLLAKAPGTCRSATLPFGGMNTVVYSLGSAPGAHETCAEIPRAETRASETSDTNASLVSRPLGTRARPA